MKPTRKQATINRQGDVLVIHVARGLESAKRKRRDKGRVVLAYGEVTGHAHAITDGGVALMVLDDQAAMAKAARELLAEVGLTVEIRDEDVVGVLDVEETAALTHEEHATIPLDQGAHVVLRQREYSPEAIRQVAD
jgi:hypothetical protein